MDRITRQPEVMGGKACVRGMRVTVGMIVGQIGAGRSIDELLAEYPCLEREDILQALQYAAWRLEEREVELEATFTVEEQGLTGFLERYCSLLNQGPGAEVTLHVSGLITRKLNLRTAHHLFRIAQAAISNARRHSDASHIGVELIEQPDMLALTIDDDGKGIGLDGRSFPGLGIRSMHFRAEEIGATLEIANRHHGGTKVRCVLPLQPVPLSKAAIKSSRTTSTARR